MKFTQTIILYLCICFTIHGQSTFSKVYDFGPGIRNYTVDIQLFNEEILISSYQFCSTGPMDYTGCSVLSTLTLSGDIINQAFLDSMIIGEGSSSLAFQDEILIAGHHLDEYEERKTYVLSFDSNLNYMNTFSKNSSTNSVENNLGFMSMMLDKYLYEKVIPQDNSRSYIAVNKLINNEVAWTYNYKHPDYNLFAQDLQKTHDGDLVVNIFRTSLVGAGLRDGYTILKLNSEGIVQDTFSFEDTNHQKTSLLCTQDGSFYFPSRRNPQEYFETSNGRINKLHASMDSVEWSIELPNDAFTDGRIFITSRFAETQEGKILVCGRVRDNTDSEVPGGDINSTFNGFILQLNESGDVEWLRIFKHPNELLDKDEFGKFIESELDKIIVLDDGRILAAGNTNYVGNQIFIIDENEEEAFFSWVILLDENGCLEENCNEIIYLNEVVNSTETSYENIQLYPNPTDSWLNIDSASKFDRYEIYSSIGSMVLEGKGKQIDVRSLPRGTYTVILLDGTNKYKGRFVRL